MVKTIRHFFPEFNAWLDDVPDSRFVPFIVYDKRFLVWWGLSLFLFQLGSRRQLDFDLDARGTHVLDNLNRLADTKQKTRPVNKTLQHFLGHTGVAPYARLRSLMIQRLIRMKALDAARLQGKLVMLVDGTGHLSFRERHCPHCLVYEHETYTSYHHKVLEAKLLGPADLTLSVASEFIDNSDDHGVGSLETRKQDCELKAVSRLIPAFRRDFPQLRVCLGGDSLFACGRVLQLAKDHDCSYVLTFKEGHMPAVWAEFQTLLKQCPQNVVARTTATGAQQVYRWVHDLCYEDDQKRTWQFHALQCTETVQGHTTTFAWISDLRIQASTVVDVATKGGRARWHIENQGFNRQKNSGFQLEHLYCINPELLKAYYYLLQIAHIIMQIFEASSLLRQLAQECGRTPWQLFGSLKNLARRLLECFRYFALNAAAFASGRSHRIYFYVDSS